MADDKKTSAPAKKPKPEAKAAAKPAKAEPAKAEAKPAAAKPAAAKPAEKAAKPAKADKAAKGKATPSVTDGPTCQVDKCKQPVRAKGYCRKHFMAWRRGETGDHHRYKTCSKEACRKPRAFGGLCDEHSGKAAPAAAAPAEGAPPA